MTKLREFTLEELLHPTTPLAKHYAKKLPIRGWAGRLTKTEKEYVKSVKATRRNPTSRIGQIRINATKGENNDNTRGNRPRR